MKPKIIVCRGLPSSGKSFWAKEFVKNNKGWIRLSNDEFRLMFFNRQFDKGDTGSIDYARDVLTEHFMKYRKSNLIIDNTNLSDKRINEYKKLADEHGYDFEIKSFTDVPLKLCIERDKYREYSVGEKVIRQMYNQFLKKEPLKISYDPNKIDAIWLDVDGSIAIHDPKIRSPYQEQLAGQDKVNEPVRKTIELFYKAGYKIVVCSGRDHGRGYEVTKKWFEDNKIPFDYMYLRNAGDVRPDTVIKKEIYERELKDKFNIVMCLDDRNSVVNMLREIGLDVFQVAEGDF